ncbi:hypothetical protein [Streptomyces sp. NPDC088554]|uniref:hypothetical protein n=1 Tax=Streptomyces sp. NPDC088554 TaxID=3365865 RepID=UPI0037FB9516
MSGGMLGAMSSGMPGGRAAATMDQIPDEIPGRPLGRAFGEDETAVFPGQGFPGGPDGASYGLGSLPGSRGFGGDDGRGRDAGDDALDAIFSAGDGGGRDGEREGGRRGRSRKDARKERKETRNEARSEGPRDPFSAGFPAGGQYGGKRSRKGLVVTVALLAVGCVGVTVAVVSGNVGSSDDTVGNGAPSQIGLPQLPGVGGGSGATGGVGQLPGAGVGAGTGAGAGTGDSVGTGAGAGTGDGVGTGTGALPGAGATPGEGAADGANPGPGATAEPAPTAPPGFTGWAGPGCSGNAYREHGRVENGDAAWYTVRTGGYVGSGCDGRFSAVPMSGIPDKDAGSTATWSWKLGASYDSCEVSVYVPKSKRNRDVAGDPTFYRVLEDPSNSKSSYASFKVRQTKYRGSLVNAGSFEVKGGTTFAVQLVDRGLDFGSKERFGAHHAAAQIKLDCG